MAEENVTPPESPAVMESPAVPAYQPPELGDPGNSPTCSKGECLFPRSMSPSCPESGDLQHELPGQTPLTGDKFSEGLDSDSSADKSPQSVVANSPHATGNARVEAPVVSFRLLPSGLVADSSEEVSEQLHRTKTVTPESPAFPKYAQQLLEAQGLILANITALSEAFDKRFEDIEKPIQMLCHSLPASRSRRRHRKKSTQKSLGKSSEDGSDTASVRWDAGVEAEALQQLLEEDSDALEDNVGPQSAASSQDDDASDGGDSVSRHSSKSGRQSSGRVHAKRSKLQTGLGQISINSMGSFRRSYDDSLLQGANLNTLAMLNASPVAAVDAGNSDDSDGLPDLPHQPQTALSLQRLGSAGSDRSQESQRGARNHATRRASTDRTDLRIHLRKRSQHRDVQQGNSGPDVVEDQLADEAGRESEDKEEGMAAVPEQLNASIVPSAQAGSEVSGTTKQQTKADSKEGVTRVTTNPALAGQVQEENVEDLVAPHSMTGWSSLPRCLHFRTLLLEMCLCVCGAPILNLKSTKRRRLACFLTTVYPLLLLLMNIAFLTLGIYGLVVNRTNADEIDDVIDLFGDMHDPLFSDIVIGCGGVLASATLYSAREDITSCQASLYHISHVAKYMPVWARVTTHRAFYVLLAWLAVMSHRIYVVHAWLLPSSLDVLHLTLFGVASATILAAAVLILHFCYGLELLVDTFVMGFAKRPAPGVAVQRWNVITAALRKSSAGLQRCFASLVFVAVTFALVGTFDLAAGNMRIMLPSVLLIGLLPVVFLQAGNVTDACKRAAPVVNSMDFGEGIDKERLYLVQYIQCSEAGMYVYDTRLGIGVVQKFMYFTGVAAFTVGSKLLNLV